MLIKLKLIIAALVVIFAVTANTQAQAQKLNAKEFKTNITRPRPKPERGFYRPFGTGFKSSSAAFWAAALADYLVTKHKLESGGREANPLFRSRDGFNDAAYWSANAVWYAFTIWLERKHPKAASWLRFGGSGTHSGAAVWNSTR